MMFNIKYRWDACNKWLYLGKNENWCIQFDEWLNWLPINKPTIRTWSLFRITWDNGNWWAFDLDYVHIFDDKKFSNLQGFFEITICGIGVRRDYKIKVTKTKACTKTEKN